jgi:16S rRNA (cytosine1402-N4)-methyltransferase
MTKYSRSYHLPVLVPEVIKLMITDPTGIYVDGTVGGGGHAEGILNALNRKAQLIGLDLDKEAIRFAEERLKTYPNARLIHANFSAFGSVLDNLNIKEIDGILLDLGVSSEQIDRPERGFSYMQDTFLDMRMNQENVQTASDLLNDLDEHALSDIFYNYGEERKSRQIARQIAIYRRTARISESGQLKAIINRVIPARFAIKTYARIFQALRIAVNHELENLQLALNDTTSYLKKGGRCLVISYHSLEDRIVKNFLKQKANPCTCPPELPECVCGQKAEFKILTAKAIQASPAEVKQNIRARSARLRAGEKL